MHQGCLPSLLTKIPLNYVPSNWYLHISGVILLNIPYQLIHIINVLPSNVGYLIHFLTVYVYTRPSDGQLSTFLGGCTENDDSKIFPMPSSTWKRPLWVNNGTKSQLDIWMEAGKGRISINVSHCFQREHQSISAIVSKEKISWCLLPFPKRTSVHVSRCLRNKLSISCGLSHSWHFKEVDMLISYYFMNGNPSYNTLVCICFSFTRSCFNSFMLWFKKGGCKKDTKQCFHCLTLLLSEEVWSLYMTSVSVMNSHKNLYKNWRYYYILFHHRKAWI